MSPTEAKTFRSSTAHSLGRDVYFRSSCLDCERELEGNKSVSWKGLLLGAGEPGVRIQECCEYSMAREYNVVPYISLF